MLVLIIHCFDKSLYCAAVVYMKKRENFGIGALFLGSVVKRYQSSLSPEDLQTRLNRTKYLTCDEKGKFYSALTFFNIMFPFGHFAKIKGRVLKDNVVEITITPIIVRAVQVTIISMYSLTLSAIRLYDNHSWRVVGILALHFAVLCTVWWVIRLVYVADARNKFKGVRKILKLNPEEV